MEAVLESGNPTKVNYRQMLKETRIHIDDLLNRTQPQLVQEEVKALANIVARSTVNFIAFDNCDLNVQQTLRTCAKLDMETHKCADGRKTYLSCCYENKCEDYVSINDLLPDIFDVARESCKTHLVEEWLENLPI